MMVTYFRTDPRKAPHEIDDTGGYHAMFSFLVDLYEHQLATFVDVDDGDA